jgi:hypothetical protein
MACRSFLRRTSGSLIVLAAVSALVLPAYATTLNGTLTIAPELGRRFENMEKERGGKLKQFYWRVPNGAVATLDYQVDAARDLVVVLVPDGSSGTAPAGQPRVVNLEGGSLNPSVVAVTPHTKVRFRNTDAFIYELECPENSQMANAQPLIPGQQVDYPFDEEGVYMITDRRLPHLVGWVVVVNAPLSKNPQAGQKAGQAAFSFEDVQSGNYKVKVFFAGDWIAEQGVTVAEEQEEVGVQISLPADGAQHQQEGESAGEGENAGAGQ